MDRSGLVAALSNGLPARIATDLTDQFLQMRQDLATGTLGRASVGKFVESLVQALQHLETGAYDASPNVDAYLRQVDSRSSGLPDGLRIVAGRVARSMYAMRSKRSIAHNNEVDPNRFDLQYLVSSAQWVLAELIRVVSGLPMTQAGALVEQVSVPVGGLVQDFGGRSLVLAKMLLPDEILVLMHSYHPTPLTLPQLRQSLDRRHPGRVQQAARRLWLSKHIQGTAESGYRLTNLGFDRAVGVIQRHLT